VGHAGVGFISGWASHQHRGAHTLELPYLLCDPLRPFPTPRIGESRFPLVGPPMLHDSVLQPDEQGGGFFFVSLLWGGSARYVQNIARQQGGVQAQWQRQIDAEACVEISAPFRRTGFHPRLPKISVVTLAAVTKPTTPFRGR